MTSPTLRQLEVLSVIDDHQRKHGYPVSIRGLCKHFGHTSTNGMNDHLKALVRKGCITRDERIARSIQVTDLGERYLLGYRLRAAAPECAGVES